MRMHGSPPPPPPPVSTSPQGTPDYGSDGLSAIEPVGLDVRSRLAWGALALASLALLCVAAWLTPSGAGLGTHEQLGLPRCGWITGADLPCPTCGMTTSFSHAADGNLLSSFRAQPMGALLALATAITVVAAGWSAVSGSRLAPFTASLFTPKIGWALLVIFIAAWIWKIIDHKGIL